MFGGLCLVGYKRLLLAMCRDMTASERLNFAPHCKPIHIKHSVLAAADGCLTARLATWWRASASRRTSLSWTLCAMVRALQAGCSCTLFDTCAVGGWPP